MEENDDLPNMPEGVDDDTQGVNIEPSNQDGSILSMTVLIVIIVSCVLLVIIVVIVVSIVLIKRRQDRRKNPLIHASQNVQNPAEPGYVNRMYNPKMFFVVL